MDGSNKEHVPRNQQSRKRAGVMVVGLLVVIVLVSIMSPSEKTKIAVKRKPFTTLVPAAAAWRSNDNQNDIASHDIVVKRVVSDNRYQKGETVIRSQQQSSVTTGDPMQTTISPTILAPARKLKVNYPIFLASFSKSGTTSTYHAFGCYLGYAYVAHRWTTNARMGGRPYWIGRCILDNINSTRPPFDGCGLNKMNNETQTVVWTDNGFTGGPDKCYNPNMGYTMEAIWDAYPEATLLYVRRNATQWFRSADAQRAGFVKRWSHEKCTEMPNTRNERDWVKFYDNHTEYIRKFAKERQRRHPGMAFVEVELESPDTGRVLEEKIGLPASCWKHCLSSYRQKECNHLNTTQTGGGKL